MIIYSKTKEGFREDIMNGVLEDEIENAILTRFGRHTPESEIRAWTNSLTYMGNILSSPVIQSDVGVAIEYNIPYTSKRVDMIISGLNSQGKNSAIIVELKQWDSVEAVPGKDAIVRTYLNKAVREVTHPSYQAWSYAMAITDFNADVQDHDVILQPCACLHNYVLNEADPLLDKMYQDYIEMAPVFTKKDGSKLVTFITDYVKVGDGLKTIAMIDGGKLRPSKSLQDCLASMMKGNREFTMIDDQKVVFEDIIDHSHAVDKGRMKHTVIVKGGPGTGKTVLAVNLLARIIAEGYSAAYVSKNSAPRNVYGLKLKGSMKKSRVDCLFKGSGAFTDVSPDTFDVLIVDEAHRLNAKSGIFSNLGENQVKELINASKLSVFFIDEDQRVTLKDIGTVDEIRRHADELDSQVFELELTSQFRCSGSDGYLEWLDDLLQIRETAAFEFPEDFSYDFRVFDDPCQMRDEIKKKNEVANKSRLLAGYCWNWIKDGKDDSKVHDITIPGTDFAMSWNLGSTSTWAVDPDSVNEVGCVHTCQGLEFDYVGVIIGPDIRYDPVQRMIVTDYTERAKTDQSLKGLKSKYGPGEREAVADRIIKDTYRVLMSRGMKGCFVYCTDPNLRDYIRKRLERLTV